ncbi:CDP-alcohol phosphatidyltransferase family protein [bacterium]|nr:CDP-alcohol phosphatidyltransferase family protein [bacterium]
MQGDIRLDAPRPRGLPRLITLGRLLLVFLLWWPVLLGAGEVVAWGLLVIIAADFLDGHLARRWGVAAIPVG